MMSWATGPWQVTRGWKQTRFKFTWLVRLAERTKIVECGRISAWENVIEKMDFLLFVSWDILEERIQGMSLSSLRKWLLHFFSVCDQTVVPGCRSIRTQGEKKASRGASGIHHLKFRSGFWEFPGKLEWRDVHMFLNKLWQNMFQIIESVHIIYMLHISHVMNALDHI